MGVQEAMARLAKMMDRECPKGPESKRLERRLKVGKGYVSKLRGKGWNATIQKLVEVAEALEIPPGVFFGRIFDVPTDPESRLRAIERQCGETPALKALERAIWKLESEEPPLAERWPSKPAKLKDLTRSSRSDQRKRLRVTHKYHTLEFMQRYLGYLDQLRYEQAETAAWISETVATEIVELVMCDRTERLELQCQALGVLASGQRLLGNFTPAARAIRLGLELARRHGLERSTAELLLRGAYVLHDHSEYDGALEMLRDAQIIYLDQALPEDVSKLFVDRGIMLGQKGDYRGAQRVFQRALGTLPQHEDCRWRLAAYHGIALALRHLKKLSAAERYLHEALAYASEQGGSITGKLIWLQGMIKGDRRQYAEAEQYLLEALRMFTACKDPLDVVLVSLDLIRVLLAQDKRRQAINLAKQMAALLKQFKDNKLAESALLELVEGGMRGEVNSELVERVAATLDLDEPVPKLARR